MGTRASERDTRFLEQVLEEMDFHDAESYVQTFHYLTDSGDARSAAVIVIHTEDDYQKLIERLSDASALLLKKLFPNWDELRTLYKRALRLVGED